MADAAPPEPDRVPGRPHPRETARLHGQEAAEAAFLAAWAGNRLPHAWLLRGPRGVGKATLAYRIARALIAGGPAGLFASGPPASLDAPPDDPVLARIQAGSEPRLKVLRRTVNPKSGALYTGIRVDEVRGLRDFLGLTAADGGWRAVIVDAADEMTIEAENALLKLLEEPPALSALLLVSHAPQRLLPTIRSRCRPLDLRPLGANALAAALNDAGAPVPECEREAVALLAGGSVGAALRLVEGEGVALYRRLVDAFGDGRAVDRGAMLKLSAKVGGKAGQSVYELTAELLLRLLARLARAAAGGSLGPEAAPGEARLAAAVAARPAQAALWAEAAQRAAAGLAHARAVNLDPGQTIVDTFLDLDATCARAGAAS